MRVSAAARPSPSAEPVMRMRRILPSFDEPASMSAVHSGQIMHIRQAQAADGPAILELAYWMSADKKTFVAEEDGTIVGTYFIRPNQAGGGAHVCNCGYMTHTAAVGRGVARSMCQHSLAYVRERGYRAMQFNFVVSTNERAARLWQSLGFAIVGRLPAAFRHPVHGYVDALVMYQVL